MSPGTDDPTAAALRWQAQHVTARRKHLRLTKKEAALRAGVSDTTWLTIEGGKSAGSEMTQLGVCTALQWEPDAFERMARLEGPLPAEAPAFADTTDMASRMARLPDHARQFIKDYIDAEERRMGSS